MSKGMQFIAAGIAAGIVLVAAFSPGKQTIGGIQALGNAGSKFAQTAEGR